MSDAMLDPNKHILVVMAKRGEVQMQEDPHTGHMSFGFSNMEGVEVLHEGDRLWWPVD